MALAAVLFQGSLLAQATSATRERTWKNSAEYELYSSAAKESDARKKLEFLDAWKTKYPETDYKKERLVLYLNAYERLSDAHKMVEILDQMLAADPSDLRVMRAILVLILSPAYNDLSSATLDIVTRVSTQALASLQTKPASVSESDWPKTKADLEAISHTALGWAAMNRKDNTAAEKEFIASLNVEPGAAQVALWLGNVLRSQKTPEKISQAFFYHARAASLDGPGALPLQFREQVADYLRKTYTSYHGQDDPGLEQLKQIAKSQPSPPGGFSVKTASEIAVEKDEEFRKKDPQLALWVNLKRELTGQNGRQYFDTGMKGADVPGGVEGINTLRAVVLSAKPPLRPKELIVSLSDQSTAEVTLKLDAPLASKLAAGSEIEFHGVAQSFIADPFMLTFEVERAQIKVLKPAR